MLVSWIRGRIVVKVAFAIIDSTLAIVEAFIFVDVNVFVFTHSIISSSAILVAIIVEELELNIFSDPAEMKQLARNNGISTGGKWRA